jgi:hypothetical protein
MTKELQLAIRFALLNLQNFIRYLWWDGFDEIRNKNSLLQIGPVLNCPVEILCNFRDRMRQSACRYAITAVGGTVAGEDGQWLMK